MPPDTGRVVLLDLPVTVVDLPSAMAVLDLDAGRCLQVDRHSRTSIEREFRRWHTVAQYASHLGCAQKSLNRATLELTEVSAKLFLVSRILLEAKRLLAHTLSPVSVVGDQLGFDEATNFVKYFRRETGSTPGAFRASQRSR